MYDLHSPASYEALLRRWQGISGGAQRSELPFQEQSKAALCREYGISRPTGDKWLERYLAGDSMSDRSRAPKSVPGKISSETEDAIVQFRKKYPAIGAVKLRRMMEDAGHTDLPCA